MQVFDASSMIYAWDNYPMRQFPGLWEWMATQIGEKKLMMPSVAFDEVVAVPCINFIEFIRRSNQIFR